MSSGRSSPGAATPLRRRAAARAAAACGAADLVVCQAGCISHNAYWLVKDHCKRTGKRCIYLERPSAAGFARGLAGLPPVETALGEE